MRILVDVDCTVVDMVSAWADWLNAKTGMSVQLPNTPDYFIATHWGLDLLKDMGIDPLDFWRNGSLYKDCQPLPGSQLVLSILNRLGHEIVFVSQLKGDHHKSKYYFLKRHFQFMKGFVGTKEKFLVNGGALIDDRISHLNMMDRDVKCIQFDTPFTQDYVANRDMLLYTWSDGVEKILHFLEK